MTSGLTNSSKEPADPAVPGVAGQLLGAWKLVSMTTVGPDGAFEHWGSDPVGTLLYTSDHRMSAALARRDLTKTVVTWDSSSAGLDDPLQGFVTYFGTWRVDEPNGAVIHAAQHASWEGLLGAEQVRYYRFDGDRLILRTPPVKVDGGYQHAEVVFQRA